MTQTLRVNIGTNRWYIVTDDPGEVTAQEIQEGMNEGLDHFVGDKWSAATVEQFSRQPLSGFQVEAATDRNFSVKGKAFAVLSFFSSVEKDIEWPYFGGLWGVAPFVMVIAKLKLPATHVEKVITSTKHLSNGAVLTGFSDGTSRQVNPDGSWFERTVEGGITYKSSERLAALARNISASAPKATGGGKGFLLLAFGTVVTGLAFMKRKKR